MMTPPDHKLTKDEQRQNAGRFGFDNWHPPHHFADPKRARSMARDIGNRLDRWKQAERVARYGEWARYLLDPEATLRDASDWRDALRHG